MYSDVAGTQEKQQKEQNMVINLDKKSPLFHLLTYNMVLILHLGI